ncbi:uncharacterized protein FIBRA_03293 [Fibroporia radiculosa]|uniref:Uncharacterized protein n=1 Tax=Fibroporia radiculosa TaxID=599839 RepID=J4H2B7_9APHY|nr:uncharacterized protein FIBRA_03293 [Fibroporia radiculosa]CCM01244.1 predicted protein [Fibroporia radiculosa]
MDSEKYAVIETLEVEDEDQRRTRMGSLLRRLDASSSAAGEAVNDTPRMDDRTAATVPPLELLSRVQAFLPQLAASNAELSRRIRDDPRSVDIENTAEAEQYIEMASIFSQLAHHGPAPPDTPYDADLREEDTFSESASSDSSGIDSGSESDSDVSESDVSDEGDTSSEESEKILRPIKPLPKRALRKPNIVVVGEEPLARGEP